MRGWSTTPPRKANVLAAPIAVPAIDEGKTSLTFAKPTLPGDPEPIPMRKRITHSEPIEMVSR